MTVGRILTKDVDTIEPEATVRTAASRMLQRNVGSLVVVQDTRRPIGIVTDRDLVIRVIAAHQDPDTTGVGSVMTEGPECISEDASVAATLATMRAGGFRRLPVVNAAGELLGVVSIDDIWRDIALRVDAIRDLLDQERPRQLQ